MKKYMSKELILISYLILSKGYTNVLMSNIFPLPFSLLIICLSLICALLHYIIVHSFVSFLYFRLGP